MAASKNKADGGAKGETTQDPPTNAPATETPPGPSPEETKKAESEAKARAAREEAEKAEREKFKARRDELRKKKREEIEAEAKKAKADEKPPVLPDYTVAPNCEVKVGHRKILAGEEVKATDFRRGEEYLLHLVDIGQVRDNRKSK